MNHVISVGMSGRDSLNHLFVVLALMVKPPKSLLALFSVKGLINIMWYNYGSVCFLNT